MEEQRDYIKRYYEDNAEKIKARSANWYADNKEVAAKAAAAYRQKNRERIKEAKRAYYQKNKARHALKARENYEVNRQAYLDRARAHKHNPETKKRRNTREQARKKEDPLFHLATSVRSRISTEVSKRGFAKDSKSAKILECDWPTYKAHLEAQFKDGMSWENRTEWHIDHITPLASATTPKELQALLHFTNTQPLWKAENLRKGAKMPNPK